MSLKKRLRYLEKAWQERAAVEKEEPRSPEERERAEAVRERTVVEEAESRAVKGVQTAEALFSARNGWEASGRYTLQRQLHYACSLTRTGICEYLLPAGYTPADFLFFDTETTGLSAGAGNSIFLMGMAWIEGEDLAVQQVFLKDFPGEAEFLSLIAERIKRHRVFVSYNGRAFDAHVLRTRFLLNRMELELEQQTDLLYWSRRLWRRTLPDCSLSTIEREILGVHRELDVPGFEVPGIYLEYLRSGRAGRLEAVLEHNMQDVRSLAELLGTVNAILQSRQRPGAVETIRANVPGKSILPGKTDGTALGNFFLSRDERWGVELLKSSYDSGDEAAGRALSLFYKRSGAWGEAVELWTRMARGTVSLFAAVELAKYFEHRERKPERALEWVEGILSARRPLDRRLRAELRNRKNRLLRKIERKTSTS